MSNPTEEEARRSPWANHSSFTGDAQSASSPNAPARNDATSNSNVCFPSPLSESYSVLPVGHGNFLKVYHSVESEPPTNYNNYELFSSNCILPTTTGNSIRSGDDINMIGAGIENIQPMFGNNGNTANMIGAGIESIQPMFGNNGNTTNMIINQLVTNWSPNLSGNYSPFGEENGNPANNFGTSDINYQQPTITEQVNPAPPAPINPPLPNTKPTSIMNASKTNGSFEKHSTSNMPEVKKRIVAEVKPMRMSYSDVLSKFNTDQSENTVNNASNTIEVAQQGKIPKAQFEKSKGPQFAALDRKLSAQEEKDKLDYRAKRQENIPSGSKPEDFIQNGNASGGFIQKEKKRSPTHENKENLQNQNGKNIKSKIGNNIKQRSVKNLVNNTTTNSENAKKRLSAKRGDNDENDLKSSTGKSGSRNIGNLDKEFYYNVAKTETNFERPQKYTQNPNSKKSRQNYAGISSSSKMSNNRYDKQSYSKRGQNKQQQNRTYEFVMKLLEKWLEYTLKVLTWLFYLVYDIVVLGLGMVYEHLCHFSSHSYIYLMSLRQDLKNNSGKPNIWLKMTLRRIDCKFKKNSKWAFWRRFYKKKREETTSDFYKNGRLPQTGDEAMYSLLNCKGKDAYSILGVMADSSQEQIRKHYKKIAVLVHPDKNKQAGAEEAFKVLQRAFELIGEPENRRSYDQSLVEALNAEKAWSELHDLLSQLQTKIAEAANTIRCSSCGLRHPRKITDRAHYAARECSSCKIRHSAREGDIWAETSCFGLRWKYLALMEGKVYDITDWANCQKGALSHLQPNSHVVQYRIVRGGQQQQQQQQQNSQEKEKFKREPPSEPSLDEFLDNLYSGQNPQGQQQQSSSRRRTRRN